MVIVDTSVWVDFFRGNNIPQVRFLERLISEENDICICGIITAEVLQGVRKDSDYRKIKSLFNQLVYLPMTRAMFVKSANMYRTLRKRGITVRKSVDCMIATIAITYNIPLVHNDKDFKPFQDNFNLLTPEY